MTKSDKLYSGDIMNTKNVLKLYHTGFLEIKEPDVNYGRKNADFVLFSCFFREMC